MIIDEYLMKVRHEEYMAAAERSRLVAISMLKPERAISSHVRILVWFGGLLRRWGSRLEDRFAAEVRCNQTQTVDCGQKI